MLLNTDSCLFYRKSKLNYHYLEEISLMISYYMVIDFNYNSLHENIKNKIEEEDCLDHSIILSFAWNIIDYADKVYSLLNKISESYYNQKTEFNADTRPIRNTLHHLEERIKGLQEIDAVYFGSLSFIRPNSEGVFIDKKDQIAGSLVILTTGFSSGKPYQFQPKIFNSPADYYENYNIISLTLSTIKRNKNDHEPTSIDLYSLRRELEKILFFIEKKHLELDSCILVEKPEKITRDITIEIQSNL
ncbi:hypothetical protein ACYSNX_02795 [Myroides sp. LJL115]